VAPVGRTTRRARRTGVAILCATAAGCGLLGETKTDEIVRGRLKFVQSATATGTIGNGEKKYSISPGAFRFEGRSMWGLGSFVVCEASPNEAREAFVCNRHEDLRELVDLVTVVNDRPRAVNIYDGDLRKEIPLPSWAGDREGAWVIVDDFLYHVETGEKRAIKEAPGHYEAEFRAVSPDAETVVYQLDCYGGMAESDTAKRMEALCADAGPRQLEVLWLVEARTGAASARSLSRAAHDWLVQDRTRFAGGNEWLAFFRSQLVWERGGDGRFQLAAPRAETP
jgi:hypothetical protein